MKNLVREREAFNDGLRYLQDRLGMHLRGRRTEGDVTLKAWAALPNRKHYGYDRVSETALEKMFIWAEEECKAQQCTQGVKIAQEHSGYNAIVEEMKTRGIVK